MTKLVREITAAEIDMFKELLASAANDNEPPEYPEPTLMVGSDAELSEPWRFLRLAIATAALEVSRRKLPDLIADAIYGFEGRIVCRNGTPYDLPDIDEAFGNEGTFRWISDFTRFAEKPPRQVPQRRVLERLRLIDLYFRIAYPERARLIAE